MTTRERDGFHPVHLYEYLVIARGKLLDFVRPLPLAQYAQEFPFAHKSIRATLVHIANAEWTYNRRLRGELLPAAAERPFARFAESEFGPLETAWGTQVAETRRTLDEITDWSRPLEWVARPAGAAAAPGGKSLRVRTTAGGLAAQLLFHEIHHRAQVMTMLRHLGMAAQIFDYSALMFERGEVAE